MAVGNTSDDVLRSAFEQSPSGIGVFALDGSWLRINDSYCELLGYDFA
jgi:PAS domain S-box-containing protein